jgi:RNA polymerase sigma factor (sigma-70 family)
VNDAADASPLEAILEQLRRAPNDQDAWEQFFRDVWPFVHSMSHRSLSAARRVLDADDVAQEVLLKFACYWRERPPAIQNKDGLLSLLAVITRHVASDVDRWLHRDRRDSRRNEPVESHNLASRTNEQSEIDLRDLLDVVSRNLNDDERQTLGLRLQGYQLSEIACELGVATRTIERRLERLRKLLATLLDPNL